MESLLLFWLHRLKWESTWCFVLCLIDAYWILSETLAFRPHLYVSVAGDSKRVLAFVLSRPPSLTVQWLHYLASSHVKKKKKIDKWHRQCGVPNDLDNTYLEKYWSPYPNKEVSYTNQKKENLTILLVIKDSLPDYVIPCDSIFSSELVNWDCHNYGQVDHCKEIHLFLPMLI